MEWFAAAFGLVVGTTMVFVPYEFGAAVFQLIYPYVRPLGSLFLVGSATMIASLLYPTWPGFVGWVGRALFLGAVAFFWWSGNILFLSRTGALFYPLLVATLLLERTARFQGRGLLAVFVASVSLCFGTLMLLSPQGFNRFSLDGGGDGVQPLGAVLLLTGALLTLGLWRRRPGTCRVALGGLSAAFLYVTVLLAARGSWTGVGVYGVLSLACGVLLGLRQVPVLSGVRWRLFRGMALASVLPILAVGAVTSYLAQRALAVELRGKAWQAVMAETAWLEQTATLARALLRAQSRDASFVAAVRAGNREGMQEAVDLLESEVGLFDAAWLLDASGETLVPSTRLNRIVGNFAQRDYFQQALKGDGQVLLSRPFLTRANLPFVVFTVPVDVENGTRVILVGGLSLQRLGLQPTLASRSYHVELFDQRDGALLRETDRGDVLTRAPVLELLGAEALMAPEGMLEALDASGRRMLVAHARVEGTPWTVVVTARLREAFAPVTRMGAWVVAIAVVAGTLSLLLSQWVGRDVAQRLEASGTASPRWGRPHGSRACRPRATMRSRSWRRASTRWRRASTVRSRSCARPSPSGTSSCPWRATSCARR